MNDDTDNKTGTEDTNVNNVPETAPEVQQEATDEARPEMADSIDTSATSSDNEPSVVPVTFQSNEQTVAPDTTDGLSSNADHASAVVLPIKEKNPKNKKILISVIVVFLVFAVGASLWLLLSKDSTKESSSSTTQVTVDIPLVRYGSTNGPIGTEYLFPKAPSTNLSTKIDFQVFEGLVGYSDQKIVPLLASSWTNPDNNTWVFTLKENVKFQNGKIVTPADVKKSLDTLVKDEDWGFYLQTIKEVSVTGANQVTIKTSAPDSLLLNRLEYGFIYSDNADKTVSGTGAYSIDAANSNTETKTKLVAFEGYHQGVPKTKAVEYTVFETVEDVTKALTDGKVDIGEFDQSANLTPALSSKGIKAYSYDSLGAYGLTLNMVKPTGPLVKKEVREALALAIDRKAFVKDSKSEKVPSNFIVPKTVVGYDETAKLPETNVAKAKELLAKAGYPNGAPLTFNYIKGLQNEPPFLIAQLNKAGFVVTAKEFPSPKEFVAANRTGDYDLFAGSFTSDLGDGLDIFVGLLDSKASQFPSYNNPEYDKMLREAEQAFKPEEHVAKVKEINRYTTKEFLWVPVSNGELTLYYPGSYDYKVDSLVGLAGAYFWKVGSIQPSSQSN